MPNLAIFKPVRIFSSVAGADLSIWVQESLDNGNTILLMNFQEVLFMDSTGLAMLVTAHNTVKRAGGRLILTNLQGQVQMLLETSNMNDFFEVYSNPTEFRQTYC